MSQRLLVYWDLNIRNIKRSHILRWIVEVVKECYTRADLQCDCIRAHEVFVFSLSWAYNNQVALVDVLSVAFVWSYGVFQNFYLIQRYIQPRRWPGYTGYCVIRPASGPGSFRISRL